MAGARSTPTKGVAIPATSGMNATTRSILGVSSDLKVFLGTPALVAPDPLVGLGRPRTRRVLAPGIYLDGHGGRAGQGAADAGVAADHLAQRKQPALARPFRGTPRHARTRMARSPHGARSLVALRTRPGRYAAHQILPGRPPADRLVESARPARAPALGDRAAVSRTQGRTGARSLRSATGESRCYSMFRTERKPGAFGTGRIVREPSEAAAGNPISSNLRRLRAARVAGADSTSRRRHTSDDREAFKCRASAFSRDRARVLFVTS